MNKEERFEIKVNQEDVQNIINCYEKDIKLIEQLQQENKELHNKIDKAIEYLEDDDNFWIPDSYSEDKVKMIQEELLKILKDSDVDENR